MRRCLQPTHRSSSCFHKAQMLRRPRLAVAGVVASGTALITSYLVSANPVHASSMQLKMAKVQPIHVDEGNRLAVRQPGSILPPCLPLANADHRLCSQNDLSKVTGGSGSIVMVKEIRRIGRGTVFETSVEMRS